MKKVITTQIELESHEVEDAIRKGISLSTGSFAISWHPNHSATIISHVDMDLSPDFDPFQTEVKQELPAKVEDARNDFVELAKRIAGHWNIGHRGSVLTEDLERLAELYNRICADYDF